jgi:hypothetical protein
VVSTLLIFSALLTGAIGCNSIDNRLIPDVTEEAEQHAILTIEEYAIYKRVLREHRPFSFLVVNHKLAGIMGELGHDRLLMGIIPELTSDTLEDFIWKNREPMRPVTFPSEDELPLLDPVEAERKYPGSSLVGYPVFSRIGFSPNGQEALVYFVDVCAPLCGGAAYYLLHRVGDGWEIKHVSETFIG